MKTSELEYAEQLFRKSRLAFLALGKPPELAVVFAGEALLREVRRLTEQLRLDQLLIATQADRIKQLKKATGGSNLSA